ncbi:ABC transporter ATP-binding protein [Bordetella genomosp. 9]|uniref:ABC transporter ATP-binding protein n=1 Tax=Bordetella genomosp. 9 TaxID=1416803 RepID=A0A261RPN1_9BORD|nr:ABC transporter ATP-binding protein [Bordetella genomosp. 9]OZI26925.1 ABC transporter ATP-binding protein [Bordetella genomosp. 9]
MRVATEEQRAHEEWVRAEGLHAHYGASHVLRGIDLRIDRGEAVGLLGRNGMGKTTLIRVLTGHLRCSAGRMRIGGGDSTHMPPHARARLGIAYVPEGRGVFPNLSVRENLMVAARAGASGRRDWDYERVMETFPRLRERTRHGGQELSGGEQQMLAIGRALMTNPDLLILDEATEGLAPLIVAELWRVIAAIRRTGISTLIVDRNYRAVLAHTDRCVVMEKGVLAHQDASATLAAQPHLLERYLGV